MEGEGSRQVTVSRRLKTSAHMRVCVCVCVYENTYVCGFVSVVEYVCTCIPATM
jgi:hypothetical protein